MVAEVVSTVHLSALPGDWVPSALESGIANRLRQPPGLL
jgi:hypothetical protein